MGTTKNTRAIRALRPGWLAVDGRTPRQLLAQTVPTAALYNFYDDTGARCGQWDAFFESVPLVRYAVISETDVDRQGRLFLASLQKLGGAIAVDDPGQVAAAWNVIGLLLQLYRQIDADAQLFMTMPGESAYTAALQQAISSVLAPDYKVALAWAGWLAKKQPPPAGFFQPAGGSRDPLAPPGMNFEWWGRAAALEVRLEEEPEEFVRQLTKATWSTKATVAQLVAKARRCFADRYAAPENLPPHFALYLAFIRQFAGAQKAINRLPARHCDFFYRKVLRLAPAGAVPDTTFVAFTAAPDGWSVLPSGTALLAGKDPAGQPVVYRTLKPTTVTDSSVAQLATVYLTGDCRAGAPGFYVATKAASADGAGAPLPPDGAWATFGADQAGLPPGARTMADGQIGFAISSPVLHLEEGIRTITLEISFLSAASMPPETPLSDDDWTLLWLADYSSAKGWAVPSGKTGCTLKYVQPAGGKPVPVSLTATLNLTVGDPACVNCDPKALGSGYDARTPVLRMRFLNPLAWFGGPDAAAGAALTAAFATAAVAAVAVNVSAIGLRDFTLAGPAGKLVPPGKPVAPFGSPPQASGRFILGKAELFRKHLTSLTVTLDWQGLPADANGLGDYYEEYNAVLGLSPPIDNTRYTGSLSALVDRKWVPIPTPGDFLFSWPGCADTPAAATGALDSSSTWSAVPSSLPAVNPAPDYSLSGPLDYSPSAVTGFLGLTLGAPDYLFGQQIYPGLVSTIAMQNALVLIKTAKASGTQPLPVAPTNFASAYAQLKTPAPKSWIGRLWSIFSSKAATASTFKPRLFTALAKVSVLPPALAEAVAAAGRTPDSLLKAAARLQGKKFTSPASFQQLIATTLGLNPAVEAEAGILAKVIDWLAALCRGSPASAAPADAPSEPPSIQPVPPPPLVPLVRGVSVDYSAGTTLDLAGAGSTAADWDRLWQLAPLTVYPRPAGTAPLLPVIQEGGCLYLGLSGIQPPETVSLLFILEAVPAMEPPDDPPAWSCLIGDEWCDEALGASAVHDSTWGFLRTGIVRIDLPLKAGTMHTVMPAGYVWLRVQVKNPAQHLRTVQVLPHAAEVSWSPSVPAPDAVMAAHFAQPLPAGAITGLQTPLPAIAKISQPLPGSGGAPPENAEDFNGRVSERLRHKGRAVAGPDYERLLLQQFPSVFSARAVPPATPIEAGTVTLVVLPALTAPPPVPPPGFVAGDLLAFEKALSAIAPLTARIVVTNPRYEPIWIRVEVDFARDRSLVYYQGQLTADVRAFISPWMYNQAEVTDPVQSFHTSDFSLFIRNRPYVIRVGKCEVFRGDGPVDSATAQPGPLPLEQIEPSSPRAMLISAATHQIDPLS